MPIVFAVRGNSLDARFSRSGKSPLTEYLSSDTAPAVVADATVGVFGGQKVSLRSGTSSQYKALYYPGFRNWTDTDKFTILRRIVPGFTTGAMARQVSLFQAGIVLNGSNASYHELEINTDSTLAFTLRDRATPTDIDHSTSSPFSFTSGVPTDIWCSWDPNGSPKLKWHQDNVLISSASPAGASFETRWAKWPLIGWGKRPGDGTSPDQCLYDDNETVIWNEIIDPVALGPRTDFITVAAFDGSVNVGAGAGNILLGATETIEGTLVTGTLDVINNLMGRAHVKGADLSRARVRARS